MKQILRITFSVFLMMLAIVTNAQTTVSTFPYEGLTSGWGDFTAKGSFTSGTTTYNVWKWDTSKKWAKASAYVNKKNFDAVGWVISPVFDLTNATDAKVSFQQTGKYFVNMDKEATLWAIVGKDTTQLTISNWMTGKDWNFVENTIDLSAYKGKKVQIGFKYISTTKGSATWEIKNFKLEATLSSSTTTVEAPTISGTTPFTDVTTVTITAGEGLEIYYTTDGTEPNDESASYTAPFTIDKTTTVKAVAGDEAGNLSEVATKEFVKQAAEEPTGTVISTFPYSEAFTSSKGVGDFTTTGQANGKDVWSNSSTYGMKATAYISKKNYASEAWLTSPVFDLTNYNGAKLSFDHAGNYFSNQDNMKSDVKILVKEVGASDWTELTATYPAGNNWTYASSGEIDLSAYNGKKIQIGFKYTSTTSRAGTWEIKNFKLDATAAGKLESVSFSTPTVGLKSVTATLTAAKGDIYYTTDGTEPSATSTKYTTPIEFTAEGTTTVKAIAISGSQSSEVASQTYTVVGTANAGTVDDPLTPADAIKAANAGYTDEVTVHGFVTEVDESDFSAKFGNITYTLKSNKDDASETGFKVYRGKGLNGASFTALTELPVGSEVTVTGKLTVYSEEPEMASGSKIVELKKADVELKEYTVAEAQAVLTAGTETTDNVYVTGIVSQIDEIAAMSEDGSKQYTNATYYISDDGTTTSQLQVFRGKYLANADYTDALQLEVGDKVKVLGVLKNYTKDDVTTQEITGSQLASLATPIEVGASGYGTLYYSQKTFTIPEGVEAYTYTVADGKLTQAAVSTTIPAGEAVVLKAAEGTYDFAVTTEAATAAESNDLLGTDAEATPEADANSYFYMVSYDKDGKNVGFYWGADEGAAFTNGAHKAYLKVAKTDAQGAKGFSFDGETTGINGINSAVRTQNGAIYNLNGQRVNENYRGVVIVNGKKMIKK